MIGLAHSLRVFLCTEPADMRRSFDGLAGMTATIIEQDPLSGHLFVFRNRGRHMLRILLYDGGGFWLCTRRLSKGRFKSWPTGDGTAPCSPLLARELQVLLWGGDPSTCSFPQLWKKVA